MTTPVFYGTPKSWFPRMRWVREFFVRPIVGAAPNSLREARPSTPHRHDCCELPGCVRHAGGSTYRLISIKIVVPEATRRASEPAGKVEVKRDDRSI